MKQENRKYTFSIVVPTMLAILMFIVSFYAIIIPLFEKSIMDRKKEMIHELTNTAWSVLNEFNELHKAGSISLENAQKQASNEISRMRYGNEQNDYFWIITDEPVMVNHPYRSDLNGKNLSDYTDNHNNKIFVDAAELVKQKGNGIIQYYWQGKESMLEVPKLSYVKGFEEWNWIIGTGIYLNDVNAEIKELRNQLFRVSLLIISIIIVILIYILNQTKIIENKRKEAVEKLKQSNEKYKSLVGASTEGTLMAIDGKVIFANNKFLTLLNNNISEVVGLDFSQIFDLEWNNMVSAIENPNKTHPFETKLLIAKSGFENIVAYITQVKQSNNTAYIIVIKNITDKKRLRLDKEKLSGDINLSLQLMNQPVKNLVVENIYCQINDNTKEVVSKMVLQKKDIICINNNEQTIGVVTDSDLKNRAFNSSDLINSPISSIMTSPVVSINQNALLYEAVIEFRKHNISHLLVKNNNNAIIGNISYVQCLEMQNNSIAFLIKEIQNSSLVSELKTIYNRVPILIQAVFTSTDNIGSVSRIITSIADAINIRVIELALNDIGEPPCKFAFIAMGSEGRSEQTLKTDQDNAIIFSEPGYKDYFLSLGIKVNENLHTIGYSRCEGDLMAGNPEWCNHIDEWKNIFTQWISSKEIAAVLDSSIFFDIRCIYGSTELTQELWKHIYSELEHNRHFFNILSKTISNIKFQSDIKRIDLKKLTIPITGYLRAKALFHSINETNSLLRLNHLMARNIISETKADEIEKILNFLIHFRIKCQVDMIMDSDAPSNTISLHNVTAIEIDTIKNITKEITKIQEDLKNEFSGGE